jgi:hypothetical protein
MTLQPITILGGKHAVECFAHSGTPIASNDLVVLDEEGRPIGGRRFGRTSRRFK